MKVLTLHQEAWRWFRIPDSDVELELRLPHTSDRVTVQSFSADDPTTFLPIVAGKWFRDFRGIVDEVGAPAENTMENRLKILDLVPVQNFVTQKLFSFVEWLDEKNDGGASA